MAKCAKAFSWAHQGIRVREYAPGDDVEDDADPEFLAIARERGWLAEGEHAAKPAGDRPAKGATRRPGKPASRSEGAGGGE